MSNPSFFCILLMLLLGTQHWSLGLEPLNPVFQDERHQDPFLTPANAQISGPLSGEKLEEVWDTDQFSESYNSLSVPEKIFDDGEESLPEEAVVPPLIRRRAIIDSSVTTTYLAPVSGFGVIDIDAKTSLVIPIFIKESPLRLAFGFGTTLFDAPALVDLTQPLYGVQAEFRWLVPLSKSWAVDLAAGGGLFSDFIGSASKGFRVTGRAILVKQVTDHLKASIGFAYLGRENLKAIPVAGVIYTPEDDMRYELLIPRSRVARRVRLVGSREHWIYAGVELFGGNSWAIEHPDGTNDVFIYRDYRLMVGYETKSSGAVGGRVEAGYAFARHLEFEKDPAFLNPDATMMLRVGLAY